MASVPQMSSWQVPPNRLCQTEKEQSRLSRVPDNEEGENQCEREPHHGEREREHGEDRVDCFVLATLSSPPSFLLSQTLWQIWQELSSLSFFPIRLQWIPKYSFLPGNDAADELARRGALLAPSAIPCSLSRLISRIHSRLISDWRRTVSSKFFDTQVSSISTEELVLPRHARCVLSRLRCNGHSLLLGSYLSRIGRIENPSCSACGHSPQDTSNLILHCPTTDYLRRSLFGDSLSLYDLWSRSLGVARLLGLHGLPPCPIPRKGSGKQQQQQDERGHSERDEGAQVPRWKLRKPVYQRISMRLYASSPRKDKSGYER